MPWLLQHLLWIIGNPIVRFYYGYTVHGKEHYPEIVRKKGAGPLIIYSNHGSQLDVIFLGLWLPCTSPLIPIYFASLENKHYQHIPIGKYLYGGRLFRLFGSLPVYPKSETLEAAVRNYYTLLKQNKTVGIFPEGKVTRDGTYNRARPGIAYLAHKTDALLLPAHISGNYNTKRGKPIIVTIGRPKNFSDFGDLKREYSREEYIEIAERMFEEVKTLGNEKI